MNEEPKKRWTKSWVFGWLIIFAFTFAILAAVGLVAGNNWSTAQWVQRAFPTTVIISIIIATVVIGLWAFIRWLCCWKNFRRSLFVCACLVTLVMLACAEEDWRGKHDWNSFKAQWEAKGEKLDWPSVIPAPVPDDQNFALSPIWVESVKAELGPTGSRQWFGDNYAENGRTNFVNRLDMPIALNNDWPANANGNWQIATLTDLGIWQGYYRNLATKTNLFPVSPQPQPPAQDVLLALSKYNPVVEELRADADARPDCRFPLDYNRDDTWQILLPHLAMFKGTSRLLELRAVAELQNGQSDEALNDIKFSFRLIDSIRTEPFLISHLVRIAMFQITMQPVYEGLAEHRWSGEQLVELDSELAKFDFLADYQTAMRGERGLEISAIESLEHADRRQFNELLDNGDMSPVAYTIFSFIPNGWLYQNELNVCRFQVTWYSPLVDETNQTVSPAQVRAASNALAREIRHRTPENFWMAWLLPDLSGAVEKFAYAQESADLARVAIALERYRQGTGVYPGSLDVLAPSLIDEIPHDIIGGQPLHYQRTSDGKFILYSVGWNGRDDGGVVSRRKNSTVDINMGDWVWRYPQQ